MTRAVNGNTDVYLILGDPVSQVRAPEAFNQLFLENTKEHPSLCAVSKALLLEINNLRTRG